MVQEFTPLSIMIINMTLVFGVLMSLGILMKIIYLIDPTRKKKVATPVAEPAPVAAATPAPAPAPVATKTQSNDEVIAAITAAVVALGYSSNQVASIRPVVSKQWKLEGRIAGRM